MGPPHSNRVDISVSVQSVKQLLDSNTWAYHAVSGIAPSLKTARSVSLARKMLYDRYWWRPLIIITTPNTTRYDHVIIRSLKRHDTHCHNLVHLRARVSTPIVARTCRKGE